MWVNREQEIELLGKAILNRAKMVVIWGRRRVGKSSLIKKSFKNSTLAYTQALEAAPSIQLRQIYQDIKAFLPITIEPSDWEGLFQLLGAIKEETWLAFDEFPYLCENHRELPSRFQKFIDHDCPENLHLIFSGSSRKMMYDIFLNADHPLYGRALLNLEIRPMSIEDFFAFRKKVDIQELSYFLVVGGIPQYWQILDYAKDFWNFIDLAFFQTPGLFEFEPMQILKDDGLNGQLPVSILELIGRGVHKASEIASRLKIEQTSLSRPLQQLMKMHLVEREIPYGESERTSKKSLYKINDPLLSFYYAVVSPHRSLWPTYNTEKKRSIIHQYLGSQLESLYRKSFHGAKRFWDRSIEIDCVRADKEKGLILSELKWHISSKSERMAIEKELWQKYEKCILYKKGSLIFVEIIDAKNFLEMFCK